MSSMPLCHPAQAPLSSRASLCHPERRFVIPSVPLSSRASLCHPERPFVIPSVARELLMFIRKQIPRTIKRCSRNDKTIKRCHRNDTSRLTEAPGDVVLGFLAHRPQENLVGL